MPARYLLTSENKVCMLPPWGSYSLFQDPYDFKPFDATTPLKVIEKGKDVALYNDPILEKTLFEAVAIKRDC